MELFPDSQKLTLRPNKLPALPTDIVMDFFFYLCSPEQTEEGACPGSFFYPVRFSETTGKQMMQQDVLGSVAQKILLAVTPNRQWNVPEQTDWV